MKIQMRQSLLVALVASLTLAVGACGGNGDDDNDTGTGQQDTGVVEDTGGTSDTGTTADTGGPTDTGGTQEDGGGGDDDAGDEDAGTEDTGSSDGDTGGEDTGLEDAGQDEDTGLTDTGTADTGTTDTGLTDTGTVDTGTTDIGTTDTGTTDTGTLDSGTLDTGTADAGPADTGLGQTPGAGDLVITEFMANPKALNDSQGEYLEIYNPSSTATYSLLGCVLKDRGSNNETIGGIVQAAPGSYTTMAISSMPGFTADYTYGGFNIGNSGDEIILECNGTVVDEVDYNAWEMKATQAGLAVGLSPSMLTATANDNAANWCQQSSMIGNGDSGTPGAANDTCP